MRIHVPNFGQNAPHSNYYPINYAAHLRAVALQK